MSQFAATDLSSVSVICVDDDPTIRSIIRFALQRHGCRDVVQAHSGPDALDLCSGREFDLMICDYQMSPMTGLDLLRELRQLGIGQSCPVLMLSAETNPETIEAARVLGVSAWIGKPISAQSLIEQVGAVLRPRGLLGDGSADPTLRAIAERQDARLLASLRAAEETLRALNLRQREAASLAQTLHHILNDVGEHARTLGYGLLAMLVTRAADVVAAMEHNPAAAAREHVNAARALTSVITAMKRVALNHMRGDGGESGLKLLTVIDGMIAPVRAALN